MKRFLAFSLALLLAPAVAKADMVIDNFGVTQSWSSVSTGSSLTNLTGDVTGTRTIAAIGPAFSQVNAGGGALNFLSTTPGGGIQLTYNFAAPIDLHSSGAFPGSPAVLDVTAVSGAWNLVVTYGSTTAGGTASFNTVLVNSPGLIGFDGSLLGNGLLASTVDSIVITLTGTSGTGSNPDLLTFSNGFVAVPEPMSIALVGLAVSSIGGVGYARRRRATKSEVAA